jgi:hypothetical protein
VRGLALGLGRTFEPSLVGVIAGEPGLGTGLGSVRRLNRGIDPIRLLVALRLQGAECGLRKLDLLLQQRQRGLALGQKRRDLLLGLVQVRKQRGVGKQSDAKPRERLVVFELPPALLLQLLLGGLDPGLDRRDPGASLVDRPIDLAEGLSAGHHARSPE